WRVGRFYRKLPSRYSSDSAARLIAFCEEGERPRNKSAPDEADGSLAPAGESWRLPGVKPGASD
ncbi:MAG TPA: hypothetical protein VGQ99_16250, partial [Tepidisphaeraceae bacterium]|nr:hypothetical protein [Tepidisphaeraceae bacterium]